MTAASANAAAPVARAAGAAALLALALRVGPLGPLAWLACALAWSGVARAARPGAAFAAAATFAFGLTSVAAAPLFALHPLLGLAAAPALALPFGLAGAAAWWLRGTAPAATAFVAAWLAVEAAAGSRALWGEAAFPALALGYALSDGPWLAAARWAGVPGLGLLLWTGGVLLARLVGRGRRPRAAAGAVLVVAAPLGLGAAVTPDPAGSPELPVRIVQPGLSERAQAAARLVPELAGSHAAFLAAASRDAPGLVLWPEGALGRPLDWPLEGGRPDALPTGTPVLLGSPTRRRAGLFNSALGWDGRRLRRVADKRVRVPGMESHLVRGGPERPATLAGARWGVLICWDAAHADLARAAADGAEALAVLANDAFDPRGPSAGLHLRLVRARAAETGVPTVFVAQSGPSAVIDARGRVLARAPHRARTVLDATLPLRAAPTPYRRVGDLPVALLGVAVLPWAWWARRRGGGRGVIA